MQKSFKFTRENKKWNAKWIWADVRGPESNAYYYFRKVFKLPPEGKGYSLCVAADTRYQLFVNGNFVGRGAPQSQPFNQYYDTYDVSDFLGEGRNCVALIVNHVGNMADTRGGLLLEIVDGESHVVACSDDSWRVIRASAWDQETYAVGCNKATPYQEYFDARSVPEGWKKAEFDAGAWQQAAIIGGRTSDRPPCAGPWSLLVARDIPFMTNTPVSPERVECVEESLDLENRSRKDLAPGLSMVGKNIQHSVCDGADNLCSETGSTVVRCSLDHLDLDFDGVYAPAMVLDFGRIITARTRIHLKGLAGGMIDIGYAERLIDGNFNIAMECEFADRYVMKDGDQVFESFTWKSFRYLKLRFRSCYEPVTLHRVHGMMTTYPYEERGGFSSSDDVLNSVFDISRATIRLCSNEFIMDTPWREQAQWLGDVAQVSLPAIHSCFGDTVLPRKFLLQAGRNQHPTGMISNISNAVGKNWLGSIPDYSLLWIRGLLLQYLYTGDEELLFRLYPQALRILDAHLDYLNADFLIEDMPYWVFIDWADVDKRGICAAYNAVFYEALRCLNALAGYRSDSYSAAIIEEIRRGLKANYHEALFDEKRECYADARIDGAFSEKVSEHSNMAPVWAGLCDADVSRKIISQVFESEKSRQFTEAQPFFMSVVLSALDRSGRFDLALDLIRTRWGKRMVNKGATSVFEEWYRNGSWRGGFFRGFMRSCSHAWSACPADFLIRNMLGLKILEPGCRQLLLNPREVDFDYHVVFPTPLGDLTAEWVDGELAVSSPDSIRIRD